MAPTVLACRGHLKPEAGEPASRESNCVPNIVTWDVIKNKRIKHAQHH